MFKADFVRCYILDDVRVKCYTYDSFCVTKIKYFMHNVQD